MQLKAETMATRKDWVRRAKDIFLVALAISCCMIVGCEYFPESTFELASESRLPKWIVLPPELTRADVSVTMSYYVKPW